MEIRRTILMIAIAIVAYLMFVTWQQQFAPDKKTQTQDIAQVKNHQQPSAASIPEANQSSVPADKANHQEETANQAFSTESLGKNTTQQKTGNKQQLIHVKTDVLTLAINPNGGDIVSLELPDYPVKIDEPDNPFRLLSDTSKLTFIAQSGLIGKDGTDSSNKRPVYKTSRHQYQLANGQKKLVVNLTLQQDDGVSITKRYIFKRGSYLIRVKTLVDNESGSNWSGAFYGQLKRDGSGDPSLNARGFSHMATYLGGAYYSEDGKYEKLKFSTMEDSPLSIERKGGWVALSQHYFLTAWVGNAKQKNNYSSLYKKGSHKSFYFLRYISPVKTIPAGSTGVFSSDLYAGPKIQKKLAAVSPGLKLTIDYGWSWFIAEPIFAVLVFLESGDFNLFGHHFNLGTGVGNWGVAIILLTIIIKLLFFKLSASSYRSMAKMRKVAPEMQRIKSQFKDDRQKQSAAMMKLYKKEKINPIGGCLPMVIQAPVFIALYYVLLYAVELRQAPFFGWIQDLSVMDPYYILPVLMGIAMFIQMQLNPTPADNTQAKVMKWMPVGFTFFFLWFPAGLVLYYVTNNILSIAQQYWITRKINAETP